jgi:hypothetical protein
MFRSKARIVIISHLSDTQKLLHLSADTADAETFQEIQVRLNFAKWLILRYPNTDTEIDAVADFELFQQTQTIT